MIEKLDIISIGISHISFKDALTKTIKLGLNNTPSFVCFANVHMTIEAYRNKDFAAQLSEATFIAADGKPIAKACKWLYGKDQERIAGMDFMPRLIDSLSEFNANIYLYGSTEETLQRISERIKNAHPKINVVGYASPPFRQLSEEEEQSYVDAINSSAAHFVLVALGCPKQEKWMHRNYKKINAVLLGVGGAFPVYSGLQSRAPYWMQRFGLEWLFRLLQEPKRLLKRYFTTNLLFIYLLAKNYMFPKKAPKWS